MGNSFRNNQRTGVVAAVAVVFFTLAGCSSLPKANPPDPKQPVLNVEGQTRQFKGFTPQQVLTAAEDVLRRHEPEAKFVQSADTLKMEWHHFGTILLGWWDREEKWTVYAREESHVTVASVAMEARHDSWIVGAGGREYFYPQKAGKTIHGVPYEAIIINYGMFWHQVQSILTGTPWPECAKVSDIRPRYFEPICRNHTIEQYEAK
jgi:hypothetical protein